MEVALTLPLIVWMMAGLWEASRILEVQQFLFNAAREGARQAATGHYTNAQVQALTLNYLSYGLGDADGAMTFEAVVTVANLNSPGTDVSAAQTLDVLQVTVTVPFRDVRWLNLKLVTDEASVLSSQVSWVCLKDYIINASPPAPPTG
jgi:hypothetical protein